MDRRTQRAQPSKILFVGLLVLGMVLAVFVAGMHAGATRSGAYPLIRFVYDNLRLVWAERDTLTGTRPSWYLQPARYAGSGVTVNAGRGADELLLISGFFDGGTELRLIRRTGEIVAKWPVRVTRLFRGAPHLRTPVSTDWNADIHGFLAEPDGSVVFNFESVGAIKLDRCGRTVWRLDRVTHHSIERAGDGGYWIGGRRYFTRGGDAPPAYSPFLPPYSEDTILKVSPDGAVLREIPVLDVLFRNRLYALITLTGTAAIGPMREWYGDGINREIGHLNDIEELTPAMAGAFPMFRAGDLLVSLRNRNLLLVFDPVSLKVKWWHVGPWVRQHDPDFQPDGTITVFNNNNDNTRDGSLFGGSGIVRIDPATGGYETVYGGRPEEPVFSGFRGKHQFLPGGRILTTEHEGGRIFEIDAEKRLIWEYVNRYDEDEVAEVTGARAYPAGYFRVTDWSCAVAGR